MASSSESHRPSERVLVVGATGVVGEEMLRVLSRRGHGGREIHAYASASSSGRTVRCGERLLPIEELSDSVFREGDLVLLGVDAALARRVAGHALRAGARVVDNSSAFRMDPAVPLVIPEVNPEDLLGSPPPTLIANPNCSTVMLLVALEPLRRAYGIEHVAVSTYQAVSGAGRSAMDELRDQTRAVLAGEEPKPRAFPLPCAFNVFPHESPIDLDSGANVEEQKLLAETRRIWRERDAAIDPSCTRVPVLRAHSQAVTATLGRPASLEEIRASLAACEGIRIVDDWPNGRFPTPLLATDQDAVLVGRIRRPLSEFDRPEPQRRRVSLWLSADQLLKGAALNAVQIAERAAWLPRFA
ncbi:MAG: aspartate-semialdehyde dehydrogenase [Planctomycetes bacterium]|nr:aspartate-semialdehyde dehydrogenase [Planctomycetota bacterium]